ncbi:MAG: hypothetical protein HRT83_06935 [Hyphomicrobiaceae bacterium]|nr:hypothetical protein [Hyphomicrobiaceae bacterium]
MNKYFWAKTVVIENAGSQSVRLSSRY